MERIVARTAAGAGAAFFGVTGAWSFLAPKSFYDTLATYPPFNEHLFHDIGAFQIGLAVMLLAGLAWGGGLRVALAGGAAAAILHALAHAMDTELGGRSTDPIGLGVFAALLVVGFVFEWRRSSS